MTTPHPRCIAYYLPQFHPTPENNEWWGEGFTEWTNTAKARPLFPGHYQPHIPADLGFYDLRLSKSRIAQAEMAKHYGIEGFCYYHYWFAGQRILNEPFDEVLRTKEPNFPFCLCWANESWTGVWHGSPKRMLIEQTYPGVEDYKNHFDYLLNAFRDNRYITIGGRPVFLIYKPESIPDCKNVMSHWRDMAEQSGLKGLYLVGVSADFDWNPSKYGFDGVVLQRVSPRGAIYRLSNIRRTLSLATGKILKWPTIYSYEEATHHFLPSRLVEPNRFPCVIPNFDNTPRSGSRGLVLNNSTPKLFRQHFREALNLTNGVNSHQRLIFIKSWNEWAEGNHLEPDLKYGKQYLDVIRTELNIKDV